MVENIDIEMSGSTLPKKVLYLTNKQCSMLDREAMNRCMEALDLGKPKCVIRLMESCTGETNFSVHIEDHFEEHGQFGKTQEFGSELCPNDSFITTKHIDLFIKNCVLPLAVQTNALIICSGSNDCTLASSLQRVITPVQGKIQSMSTECQQNVDCNVDM